MNKFWKTALLYTKEDGHSKETRLRKLDGVRGVLALMVVLYHFEKVYLPYNLHDIFVIRQSYVFVDFFFVLSGFVISLNYNRALDFKGMLIFIKKRVLRLYPLLFFSTTIYVLYRIATNYVKLLFPSFSVFENTDTFNALELLYSSLNTYLMTNSTPILGSGRGVNYPSWSISSEMISYIVYGVLFYFLPKYRMGQSVFIILVSVIFLFSNGSYFASGDFGFIRGLLAFNLGCVVYYISKVKIKLSGWWELMIVLVFILLLYFLNVAYINEEESFIYLSFLVPVLSAISVAVFIRTDSFLSRFFETPILQFFGKISYSIYLNHALLLFILPKLAYRVLKVNNEGFSSLVTTFAILFIIVVYSRFTYLFVEIKGRKFMVQMISLISEKNKRVQIEN
jgi:peptidoglycan/LPS O-acetylase OafA/YrhL